jgi:small subunit ribosomal protein S8
MAVIDPIGDLLTRIQNASDTNHDTLEVPDSKIKREILRILQTEGFIKSYEVIADAHQNFLRVILKYQENEQMVRSPIIQKVKRVSPPGNPVFLRRHQVPLHTSGVMVLTTSQGVMTNKQARRKGVGGEVIAIVS